MMRNQELINFNKTSDEMHAMSIKGQKCMNKITHVNKDYYTLPNISLLNVKLRATP